MRQWSHTDLSQIANAPPCGGTGGFDVPRPMGCVRSDQINAVFFTGHDDRHVHQLHLSGNIWVHTDLSLLTNATDFAIRAETSPMACVRPDKVFSVVYTGRDGHIHALQIAGDLASHADLSDVAGAPKAMPVGPPTHFVRGDGVMVVVYTGFGGENSSVHQLAFTAGRWVHSNLSELTQSPPIHSLIKTAGYVRANQTTSVIYVAAGIKELALPASANWTSTDLFNSVQAPRPHPLRWPMGFVRADGTASVLYADQDEFSRAGIRCG